VGAVELEVGLDVTARAGVLANHAHDLHCVVGVRGLAVDDEL
jgi:hypothetical protein